MRIFLRLLSFYFPITKTIQTDYSGQVSLTFTDGKQVLDSAYLNYSYGSVQKVLEFAFGQIDIRSIRNVLLLGLGGGCAVKSLRNKFQYRGTIDAVDIDPVMIDIANKEYGIRKNRRTKIECCEASLYIKKQRKVFDLVIVDLFIDNRIPKGILCPDFWRTLKDRVSTNGYIIFNSMHEDEAMTEVIKNEMKKWGFEVRRFDYIERYNTVLIAKSCLTWFG